MEILTWPLSVVGAIGAYASGKHRWGWAVSVLYQILWIAYAVYTKQYGFIWVCIVYAGIYSKNFYQGGTVSRDLNRLDTYNADGYYPNMLVCNVCGDETEAGTLQEMLDWANIHDCDTSMWWVEHMFTGDPGEWSRRKNPITAVQMRRDKEHHAKFGHSQEYRYIKVEN